MQAVLLAAGKSSRFYPYNKDLEHKSFLIMMGKTLLEHTIEALEKSGIDNIIIVVSKDSSIASMFAHKKNIICVVQEEPLGMGDALLKTKDFLQDKFFVLGSYHMDIVDFAEEMQQQQQDDNVVVLVKKDEVLDRYGNVTLEKNKVIEIVEKPEKVNKESYRLNAIYLLNKNFLKDLESIPTEEYHFEKALSECAKKGKVNAVITEKPTITLKYAWDILGIKDYLLSNLSNQSISSRANIASDAIIDGPVVIEENATVLEGVCIKGPAYVGKNVTIGNRAILRNGVVIEDKSVVGSQMEIKNTFMMGNSTTHEGFIGDSIVGQDTKIAAGFITANARLDRQFVSTIINGEKINTGVRHLGTIIGNNDNIGIRVSTMPGIIIGNNVIVGPSTTIMKNILDNKKYFTKFAEIIEENNEK